jgi:hypothetical protein
VVGAFNAGFTGVPAVIAGGSGGLPLSVDTSGRVDVLKVNGTSQTAGDIPARLPAALTANGNMKSSLMEIIATALTETSGLLAAAFKKFFNVATPTGTANSLPDAVPGAAGGVFIAGTNAPVAITGSGDALTLTSTGSNGSGLKATGQGTGNGFNINSGAGNAAGMVVVGNGSGAGIAVTTSGGNANGIEATGNGTGDGMHLQGGAGASADGLHSQGGGGATARGIHAVGGSTSGAGFRADSSAGNTPGIQTTGNGSGAGIEIDGGATGPGALINGGGTSGDGVDVATTSGDGVKVLPTAGNALVLTANGTSKHGAVVTGGTAGTSDGLKAVAGSGGVDIRGAITGNITGNLSGSVGSVTNPVHTTYQIKKNTALAAFEFPMFDSTNHNPATGLTVSGFVSLDGGAFGSLTNAVSGVASGVYKVDLAAADVNGNVITLRFTATGADDQLITFVTQT